jgi:hypothetical protein
MYLIAFLVALNFNRCAGTNVGTIVRHADALPFLNHFYSRLAYTPADPELAYPQI